MERFAKSPINRARIESESDGAFVALVKLIRNRLIIGAPRGVRVMDWAGPIRGILMAEVLIVPLNGILQLVSNIVIVPP
jgi:hypothetical protein